MLSIHAFCSLISVLSFYYLILCLSSRRFLINFRLKIDIFLPISEDRTIFYLRSQDNDPSVKVNLKLQLQLCKERFIPDWFNINLLRNGREKNILFIRTLKKKNYHNSLFGFGLYMFKIIWQKWNGAILYFLVPICFLYQLSKMRFMFISGFASQCFVLMIEYVNIQQQHADLKYQKAPVLMRFCIQLTRHHVARVQSLTDSFEFFKTNLDVLAITSSYQK